MEKRTLWVFLLFCFPSLLQATTFAHEEPELVHLKTNLGELTGTKGVSRDGRPYFQFLGIPYALVPQRFMESVEVLKLTNGAQVGTEFGSQCSQLILFTEVAIGTEDCLFLNVFSPSLPSQIYPALPVLVFIHGGYFISGSGDVYSPQYFMDEDVVVVTINYRLSVFGFLNLNMEEAPGNQGLKDQVLALKWIQKNIKDFGGDETKVTIFGESAGGASVGYHLLSPLSKGLFHRAISQSGTAACNWVYNGHPEQAVNKLADKVGCKGSKKQVLECLVNIDAVELMKALPAFSATNAGGVQATDFVPSLESRQATYKTTIFLSKSPMELLLDEMPKESAVPWIVGYNVLEGYLLTNEQFARPELEARSVDELKAIMRLTLPAQFKYVDRVDKDNISDQLEEFYFGDNVGNRNDLSVLLTDMMFLHCSLTAAQLYKGPAYFYQFDQAADFGLITFLVGGDQPPKPTHGDEMTFQWHFNSPFIDPAISDIPKEHNQYGFSKNFVHLWTHFAAHGIPMAHWNGETLRWNPVSSLPIQSQTWLHLKQDAVCLPVDNDIKARLELLHSLNVTLAY